MINLQKLATEQRNAKTNKIDSATTLELVQIMNDEDHKVADAVHKILPQVAAAVDMIASHLRRGGRLFYVGSGTSGRLGILDAAECPPTFSTSPELVQGILAGGESAVFRAKEGAEDDAEQGAKDLAARSATNRDVVVGISASDRTPYVVGALTYARQKIGAATIAICCSADSAVSRQADFNLCALVGPEVITGSTRMKAGTAEKMLLNMLSTGAMVKLGKVYGNLMVDLNCSNEKLQERAVQIVMAVAECDRDKAVRSLTAAQGNAKEACLIAALNLSPEAARQHLAVAGGFLGKALTLM